MAIRKSAEEEFVVKGNIDEWLPRCQKALEGGEFKNIKFNKLISQFEADYKTFKVHGGLIVTLIPKDNDVLLKLKSTGNMDNIWALLKSPNQIILSKFKDSLFS